MILIIFAAIAGGIIGNLLAYVIYHATTTKGSGQK